MKLWKHSRKGRAFFDIWACQKFSRSMTRQKYANITQYIFRNATKFFFFGANSIGAKALKTKWMHLYDAYLKDFAQFLNQFNAYGIAGGLTCGAITA